MSSVYMFFPFYSLSLHDYTQNVLHDIYAKMQKDNYGSKW